MSDSLAMFTPEANNQSNGNGNNRNFKKADAFLNIGVRNPADPDSVKNVGGIPLYRDKPFHAAIIAALESGKSMDIVYDLKVTETAEQDFSGFFTE